MKNNEYSADQIRVIDLRKKTLTDALLEIEKRPWLWLHTNDVSHLKSFLNGWIVGRNNEKDEALLSDFDNFVVNEFNEGHSTAGWCNIIIEHCGEKDTLSSFFNLFHKYRESIS